LYGRNVDRKLDAGIHKVTGGGMVTYWIQGSKEKGPIGKMIVMPLAVAYQLGWAGR
jgi:hypothetical protein